MGGELLLWTLLSVDPACPHSTGVNAEHSPARLAVRDLDDLVGLVPYLVGFQPAQSLVIVVTEGNQVAVTARVDLPSSAAVAGLDGLLRRVFGRFTTAEGWFLAYTDDVGAAWPVLDYCAEVVGTARLGRLVQVGSQHWCADHPEGPSGSVRPSAAAVEAAVAGLPLRASREELAAQIAGPPDDEVEELLACFEIAGAAVDGLDAGERRRRAVRLLRIACERQDFVELAVLAGDRATQRAVLAQLDATNAAAAVAVWTAVVRHCLVAHLPGPLGLLGVSTWLTGDGALLTVCLERLDRLDPLDPLAALLDWINSTVLPPVQWPICRSALVSALQEQDELLRSR